MEASVFGVFKRDENGVNCPVRNCTDYIEHTRPPLFPADIDPLHKKFQIICSISNDAIPCINNLRDQCDGTEVYASAGTFQALLQYICHDGYKEFLAHYDCWSNSYWQYRMGVCHNLAPDATCSDLDELSECAIAVTSEECGSITGEYIQRVLQRGRDFFHDFLKYQKPDESREIDNPDDSR
ncbi:hypothetical protein LOTGIDRAFT_164163 [Lottia gigantea]|uniref:DUF19 domain-containing protein n=1 Tax=Lottia gigantea TaxID=225164 RepID=V4A0N5_LOTGI|nr:hypothetical protein LOTGIDRAFT_164163 [Lottia gigantea]ESO90242.1 hypothetical protein LOTGIDRAFT_164163 [Lottia gigantea]